MENIVTQLEHSLYTGFINKEEKKIGRFKPQLLLNNPKKNENVLNVVLDELYTCQSFLFSIAFVTESGLATLKSHLLDLKAKGIKGRILTSTFLNFNQPKIFRELLKLENVEVRLSSLKGFHSKGYIFKQENHYSLIVGSSNLTAQALKVNYEWNVKLTSLENGEIVHHFHHQFEDVWNEAQPLSEEWIKGYEQTYKPFVHPQGERIIELPSGYDVNPVDEAIRIEPNKMQQVALQEIQLLRDEGKEKGLVISATGTGKTYLSAFDVRRFAPKRMLFIVHREQILKKAKSDFQKVLGGIESEFGLLSGTAKDLEAKYLFATIQTLSKEENLKQFHPEDFDYILIDEVHKAGASSYHKILEYFKPSFLMGMTATPERTDDYNIFKLFDYNIAYEIRLQEALEEEMLCPFHYFGVTDLEIEGNLIEDTTILSKLVTEERVNHIIEKVDYYGFSGDALRGLIFCSRKEEAGQLSIELNKKGFCTVALTGDHSQQEREVAVEKLEKGLLDYIITVDIFNEGVDIPSVNQVVMLRQTQSSIIFIQQLGRGLRKHSSKEYVTIIDFIGNYKNNYLIPVALSGDKSQNKDNLRRHVKDTSYIKGVSTINFEEVAKKQIFKSINNSRLTTLKQLKESYQELKNRIGRQPYLYDFIKQQSIDPNVLVNECGNYYQFLLKISEEVPDLSTYENQVLTMFSLEFLNGKRKHEWILLDMFLQDECIQLENYFTRLQNENCIVGNDVLKSVQRMFTLEFFTNANQKKYGDESLIILGKDEWRLNNKISESLNQNVYFRALVKDIISCSKANSRAYDSHSELTLYKKYSRKDVCKLLNWENDESSTVYGYKTKHGTCPLFVTYHKHEEVESSVAYGDEFLSQNLFKWYTRSNRTLASEEVKTVIDAESKGINIHLFVKKDNGEGTDFYYLGKGKPDKESVKQTEMKDKHDKVLPVVHMNMVMEQPVENQLYHYLVEGSE